MRTNGYIYPLTVTVPEQGMVAFNEYGEPSVTPVDADAPQFGEPIECWAQTNTDEAKGVYEDGEFRRCAFTVLIEQQGFEAKIVRLEKDGEDLGAYRVMQSQKLMRMGRTSLMLRQ